MGLPGGLCAGYDFKASTAGAWVQTLVRELGDPGTTKWSSQKKTHKQTKAIKNQVINF